MSDPGGYTDQQIEQLVREHLGRLLLRYVPVAAGALVIVLVVTTLPSVRPRSGDASFSSAAVHSRGAAKGDESTPAGSEASAATASDNPASGPASGALPAASSAVRRSGSTPAANSTPSSGPPRAPTASTGTAASGVTCGPGVRQVSWSHYAPMCKPVFHGNNGGATAPGVTDSTITLTFRTSGSSQSGAVGAALGSAALPSDDELVSDYQAYIDLFNKQFELYGRHVVLKVFRGQGDPVAETEGQGLQGAQADAATARSVGAFGDASSPAGSETQPYAEALAANHVISFGTQLLPQRWYEHYAPYAYEWQPTGDTYAVFTANEVCQRMARMPAAFAGSQQLQTKERVFGLLVPDLPDRAQQGDMIEAGLGRCGVKLAKRVNYSWDLASMQSEATSAMAQLAAAGVTTVICACDPIFPTFATNAADQQQYYPEWDAMWWPDTLARNYAADQWAHAITTSGTYPDATKTEAYRAFKLARPSSEPAEIYYSWIYRNLLTIFSALHIAGANLTATTFMQGYFAVPDSSPDADFGPWTFGDHAFSPAHHFQIGWWNPNAKSNFDGGAGAYQDCNGGQWYKFDDPGAFAPA